MDLLWTIVIILVVLWLLGFIFFGGLGFIIHLLLVIALVIIVYRLWKGKNVVTGK
jgi:hypothetical protein